MIGSLELSCVISSFITKPQRRRMVQLCQMCCVISSFITKPQPLSASRNARYGLRYILFHHQTTTRTGSGCCCHPLRYILFHHQTTTAPLPSLVSSCCVISSFITKPQLIDCGSINPKVALYPLSSPNHNCTQVC